MRHHVLYLGSTHQIELTRKALLRLRAKPTEDKGTHYSDFFEFKHPLIGHLTLAIHLVDNLDAMIPHLRQNPVDLLIYDERRGAMEALKALAKIKVNAHSLAEMWGPDFLFPMSRVVTILQDDPHEASRTFELGRLHVRDVCVAPQSTATVLRWLRRILISSIRSEDKFGMALSGGGLEGFLYQMGVVHAIKSCLAGKTLESVDSLSGISSGSICAALIATGVPTGEVIKAMHGQSDKLPPLYGKIIFDLASKSIGRRILKESIRWAGLNPNLWLRKVLRSIPTGFFKGQKLKDYFHNAILTYHGSDSFRELRPDLFIGATDQDSFEHVTFGLPPWDDLSISEALRASCSLPPFFTPVKIQDRFFIDGQVTRTCNLELLVERGCRLIIIIDPVKPYTALVPGTVDKRGGVYATIQTIKALVHSRFHNALSHVTERYPDVDFMVFQPDEECAKLMAGNPMRYKMRTAIVDFAFRTTVRQIKERYHIYQVKLNRLGYQLKPLDELSEQEKLYGKLFDAVA